MQEHNSVLISGAIGLLLGSLIAWSHVVYMELLFVLFLVVINRAKIGQIMIRVYLHFKQNTRSPHRP